MASIYVFCAMLFGEIVLFFEEMKTVSRKMCSI
jgi:hypothetical protein